jgi:hypothetical protein
MARYRFTTVSCDLCGCGIDHVPVGADINNWLRRIEAKVSKHGDFCNKTCLKKYKDNGNQPC